MRFTQPGPYFLAFLLALSIPTLGCGRGASEEEQDQASIEQGAEQEEEEGTFDSGDQTAAKDPEVPTRRIEVIEPEDGDDIGADPVLDERERRLAERQAELDARERRLRELREPRESPRVAQAPARPAPEPREPKREPKVAAPEPREPEERQARAPRPAPPVERPAKKPVERPAEPEETEIAENAENAENDDIDVRDAENTDRNDRADRNDRDERADREREQEEQALREEREARRREEDRTDRTDRTERTEERSERSERSERPEPETSSVPAGTVMEAQFLEGVSSESSEPGDIFRARIANDVTTGRGVAIPAGSEVIGVVTEAVATRKVGGRAKLAVKFTDLVLPSGSTVPIRASFVEQGRSQTGKDAATIGGSAAGGAVIGRILNRKDRSRGAVIGAIIGAAAGTILASRTPGEEVSIPEGTVVNLRLDDGVEVRRRR